MLCGKHCQMTTERHTFHKNIEALVTEPGAVATGSSTHLCPTGLFRHEIVNQRLNVGSGRYRSRFCNESAHNGQ